MVVFDENNNKTSVGVQQQGAMAPTTLNVVTYDEEAQPVEAHAVPLEATPIQEETPLQQTSYDTAQQKPNQNKTPAIMGDNHGCDCSLCGDVKVRSLTPGRHFSFNLCGNTYLDLLDANYPPGSTITLLTIRLCGDTQLIVPPGTQVIIRRLLLCGNRDIQVEEDPEQQFPAPRLTIYILSLCGDVRVRSHRNDMSRAFSKAFSALRS